MLTILVTNLDLKKKKSFFLLYWLKIKVWNSCQTVWFFLFYQRWTARTDGCTWCAVRRATRRARGSSRHQEVSISAGKDATALRGWRWRAASAFPASSAPAPGTTRNTNRANQCPPTATHGTHFSPPVSLTASLTMLSIDFWFVFLR